MTREQLFFRPIIVFLPASETTLKSLLNEPKKRLKSLFWFAAVSTLAKLNRSSPQAAPSRSSASPLARW